MNADEIRQAREALGMTQADMATALGSQEDGVYSARAVRAWESGQSAVPPAVAKLVRLMLKVK